MTSKWQIDSKFLQKTIDEGYALLNDSNTPKSKIPLIKEDIKNFKQYLEGNYDGLEIEHSRPPLDIEKLKNYILRKMKKQYQELGPELINWIIDLSEENVFNPSNFNRYAKLIDSSLTIDEQADLTLETYKKYSKKYYGLAKKIILDEHPKQIQLIDDGSVSSYCWHSAIYRLPLLIIDPTDSSWILNHETQHAIEDMLDYDIPIYFVELGATYFELLFNDELYKNRGFISINEYLEKMEDNDVLLSSTAEYFSALVEIAKRIFCVPTDKFLEIFIENCYINPDFIYEFLRSDVATSEIEWDMDYVFSYLKAIELREKSQGIKKDSADLLEPYINNKRFNFQIPNDGYQVYERFIEEVKEKTKTK